MALTIEFETTGTGGVLTVGGLTAGVGQEVLVAVQRTDDGRWLTLHGLWGSDANWFPCPRLETAGGAARFVVQPPLAAGLGAAHGLDLVGHLRRFDFTDAGPLRLVASEPTAEPAPEPEPEPEPIPSPAAGAPPRPLDQQLATSAAERSAQAPADQPRPGPAVARPAPTATPARRRVPLWSIGVTAAILASGVLLWFLIVPRPLPDRSPGPGLPPAPQPGIPTPTATGSAATGRPVGRALAAALKAQGLAPADLYREAETAAAANDCDAAIRLFIDAAKSEAGLADRLAGRYDPEGFTASPCFPEPKPDSALRWYQQAAEQGIAHAQRRFGELLLTEGNSGPLYREAVDWLRKAAATGDQAAAQRLTALGEGGVAGRD
jgi:hypothetical protein